jgi:DnaJ-domain-containing protein 1
MRRRAPTARPATSVASPRRGWRISREHTKNLRTRQVKLTRPDYYAILQVHPLAEQEIVEAAYRRLMRKYHPDIISAAERNDPDVQRKAREINEAYAILRDRVRRAAYDKQLKFPQSETHQPLEKRWYSARCSRTDASFRVMLARQQGANSTFRVTGFEGLEVPPTARWNLIAWILKRLKLQRPASQVSQRNLTPEEVESLVSESVSLDFGSIDWGGFHCPACSGTFTHPDGTLSTWVICGKCARISCAGGIKRKRGFGVYACPSCKKIRQVTYHVPVGKTANKRVGGMVHASGIAPDSNVLEDKSKRNLPSGGA